MDLVAAFRGARAPAGGDQHFGEAGVAAAAIGDDKISQPTIRSQKPASFRNGDNRHPSVVTPDLAQRRYQPTAFEDSAARAFSNICSHLSKSLVSIARTKVSTMWLSLNASSGVTVPLRGRLHDRPHRGRNIGGALDRRYSELDRPFAAWRYDAVETEPQRRLAAADGKLDRLPAQCLGFAVEECVGGERRLVARAARTPGRITRPPLLEEPPRPLAGCFCSEFTAMTSPLWQRQSPRGVAISLQNAIVI